VRILLISTYELGRQPLHVAAPAGALRAAGHEVRCLDLAVEPWDPDTVEWADRVALSVPMHTATRLARDLARIVERPTCAYGLYAEMVADECDHAIAGEYTAGLLAWAAGENPGALVQLARERVSHARPVRDLLPSLDAYARYVDADGERLVGTVEASHGCSHRCRHCPVPVVYDGRTRGVDADWLLDDVAHLVDLGARHLTFADADFLNRPGHAVAVARAVHRRFPDLTFDCTVKVEHVLRHADVWPELAASGCTFVVSAFESVDDSVLIRLDKGHTVADAARATEMLRAHHIEVRPSWLPFHPWTTDESLVLLLDFVADQGLVANVDPVQYAVRLLVPRGSLLLAQIDVGPWDPQRLTYSWASPLDDLQRDIATLVEAAGELPIEETYAQVRSAVGATSRPVPASAASTRVVPRLTESWFCCAEPTERQRAAVGVPATGTAFAGR